MQNFVYAPRRWSIHRRHPGHRQRDHAPDGAYLGDPSMRVGPTPEDVGLGSGRRFWAGPSFVIYNLTHI